MIESFRIRFPYDPNKGLAMLEYLLELVGGKYNQMALLKLAFFADRYHVRNYARPVSADEYYALKLGPIPSNLRDIIETERYYPDVIHFQSEHDVELRSRDIDLTCFSKSDVEAMKFSVDRFAIFGEKNEFDLANLTHAYPEWDKYRDRFLANSRGREEMDYADFLKNADTNHEEFLRLSFQDPFQPLSNEEQEDILAEMQERTLAFA
jgi:hypothetical protein